MGGFAALHIAFTNTDMFCKVGGHMPALILESTSKEFISWVYPDDKAKKLRDPIELAKRNDLSGIKVYLDCGESDRFNFYEGSMILHNNLISSNMDSRFFLNKGEHSDRYLKKNLESYMLFYSEV